jgi:hypothetical protein
MLRDRKKYIDGNTGLETMHADVDHPDEVKNVKSTHRHQINKESGPATRMGLACQMNGNDVELKLIRHQEDEQEFDIKPMSDSSNESGNHNHPIIQFGNAEPD